MIHQRLPTQNPKTTWRQGVLLWMVLLLATICIYAILLFNNYQRELERLRHNQQSAAIEARTQINHYLASAVRDIQLLSSNPFVKSLSPQATAQQSLLAQQFFDGLMQSRPRFFSQLRLISLNGDEIIRINNRNGSIEHVTAENLQNKRFRYYFRDSLYLGAGQIYVSAFDLNIEHGKVVEPLEPTLRLGAPLFDLSGKKSGVIVINLLGTDLLAQLRQIGEQHQLDLYLANLKGYWLIGPDPDQEWGFVYPSREKYRFGLSFPETWNQLPLQSKDEVVAHFENGDLLSTSHFSLTQIIQGSTRLINTNHDNWTLLLRSSAQELQQIKHQIVLKMLPSFALLLLLLTGLSIRVAQLSSRQRQATENLQQREQQFFSLLEAAPDAIIVSDAEGTIVMSNAQTEDLFLHARKHLIGQKIETLIPERFHANHGAQRADYLRHPLPRNMGEGLELKALRGDGKEFPVSVALNTLQGPQGQWVISAVRDMSESFRQSEQLHTLSQRLELAVNATQIGIWEYRTLSGQLIWDDRLKQLYGLTKEFPDLDFESWISLVERPDREQLRSAIHQAFQTSGELNCRFRIRRPDTEECRWLEAKAIVRQIKSNGLISMIGTQIDISEIVHTQHQLEQAVKQAGNHNHFLQLANADLEALSHSISHELRTPLRSLEGYSHLLQKNHQSKLNEEAQKLLQQIRESAQLMGQRIDDMLSLSRISQAELELKQVDLSALAQQCVEALQETYPERQIQINIQPRIHAWADPGLISIVLENLIQNAWKFTHNNPYARIEVGVQPLEQGREFFVRDNGVGFDMKFKDKLFQPFQQLHDEPQFRGHGIGLATVKRIVQKHQGQIRVEAGINRGATFRFCLPEQALEQQSDGENPPLASESSAAK